MTDGGPVEIRLDQLLFLRNVPAGMDPFVVGHWAMVQRKGADPVDPPIRVFAEPGTPFYRVSDGRHRVLGALLAGRDTILAVIEAEVTPNE